MGISNELLSKFVKATKDDAPKNKETTAIGTVIEATEKDGMWTGYVRLDGAPDESEPTPITSTVDLGAKDRVSVALKDHGAIVTGNITSPSTRKVTVEIISEKKAEEVQTDRLSAINAEIEKLKVKDTDIENLKASKAEVETLKANKADLAKVTALEASIKDLGAIDLTAVKADIENLKANKLEADDLSAIYASISNLSADKANVSELDAVKASITSLDSKYANIDFTNVNAADIRNLYATSGLIQYTTMEDATVTGELVGVTISGDLIKADTIKANSLIIQGEDGLYYKLNTNGVDITSEQVQNDSNSLNGKIIMAKSIVADQISVSDLSAFEATIGGFVIDGNSIHSSVKEIAASTIRGIYMDTDGRLSFGDATNFVKYYSDTEGNYHLEIAAESIKLGAEKKDVEETIDSVQANTDTIDARLASAESLILQLATAISMMVTDGQGSSLMTQTSDGWTFNMQETNDALFAVSSALDDLKNEVGDAHNTVEILKQAVADLGETSKYIAITTDNDEPCIELGTSNSDFKLRITNTSIKFMDGSSVPAYVNNKSLYIKKAVIEEEMQQGNFVWAVRSNGNMGLIYRG